MTTGPAPMNVVIVEDEALLAMDIEAIVEDSGHVVIAIAASSFEVDALPGSLVPHLAFVDVQLAEGTSGIDACATLRRRWPDMVIVFVTANPAKVPADFAGAQGIVPKPFTRNGLMSAMRYIVEGVQDPPPTPPMPASFIASPTFAALWTTH